MPCKRSWFPKLKGPFASFCFVLFCSATYLIFSAHLTLLAIWAWCLGNWYVEMLILWLLL